MFQITVKGTTKPSEEAEVNHLYSAEDDKQFVLNGGNKISVRTGVSVDVPSGFVGLIFAAMPDLTVVPKMIPPGLVGEIVLTVVNDSSIAKWIQPGELLADITIAKVAEKSNAKRKQTGRTKGRTSEGDSEQSDEGSSAAS